MKHARPILITAATLALFISACSQPQDAKPSTLVPQFGTAQTDKGVDVTLAPEGGTYVLSRQFGFVGDYDYYDKVILSRYSSAGNKLWTRNVDALETFYDPYSNQALTATDVEADSLGNSYVLSSEHSTFQDYATSAYFEVAVHDKNGQLGRSFPVGHVMWTFEDAETVPDMTLDASGNVYVAIQQATVGNDDFSFTTANLLRKYTPAGKLVWERVSSVGVTTGVASASDGSVYLSGKSGLARYSASGTQLWKKSGFYNGVAVSGPSIFVNTKNTVYRFSSSGRLQGSSFMGGLSNAIIQDLGGDGAGGVLVSGKYTAGTGNWNAFVRKLNAAGASQWTSTYGTPAYDDARGVMSVGSGIYATGTTLGSLAHPNKGEEDGYVRKLSATGQPIWTR